MSHKHLTIEERSQITALLSMGHNQKQIAKTISRELKRNKGQRISG